MRGYVTARRLRSHVSREIPGCYVGARSISVALPSTTNEIGWATRGAGGQPGWAWHRSRSLLPASAGVPSVYFLSELISIYVRRRIMRKPSRTEWSFFLLNFLFEIIEDSHAVRRNDTERSCISFTLSYGDSLQNQYNVTTRTLTLIQPRCRPFPSPSRSSCCPIITVLTFFPSL